MGVDVRSGYQPTTGAIGSPPSGGSNVAPPSGPRGWRLDGTLSDIAREEYETTLRAFDDLMTCGANAELRIAVTLDQRGVPEVTYIGVHKKRSIDVLKRLYVRRQEGK